MALTEANCPWLFPVIVPAHIYASLSGNGSSMSHGETPLTYSPCLWFRRQTPRMGKSPGLANQRLPVPVKGAGSQMGMCP